MDVLTTPPLPLVEWLSVVESEYLSAFVPAGGAAVKFAILDGGAIDTAAECIIGLGQAHAMLTVQVDAGRTRIHLMHELFFAIARASRGTACCSVIWKKCSGRMPIPGRGRER